MRTIFVSALTLIVVQVFGAAWGQSNSDSEIAPQGRLRVALIGANPVLVTRSPDGTIGGVSVDLGKFIAEKLGVPFVPVVYADPDAYTRSFGTGEWDIAIGPRRGTEIVAYTPDFMFVDNLYVAAPGREFGDVSQVDRPGIKVAVAQNGAPDAFLTKTLKSAEIVRVPGRLDAAIEVLRTGRADVYGSNGQFVYDVVQGLRGAKIVPGAFTTVHMAVAFSKSLSLIGQERLAQIVCEAKASGLVQKSIERAELKGVRAASD